jgi:phosphatidylglycerophosphate synthase
VSVTKASPTAAPARLARSGSDWLGPAMCVTIVRAALAIGVAALVVDSFRQAPPVALLVALAVGALMLDWVDGWVARRTDTTTALGARLDGEVDAFLIAALSLYVARSAGWWVLAIGAARYVFLAAGWALPWLREPLPPRYWRKVVAATLGIALTIAAAGILPPGLTRAGLVVALALAAESFGRDVAWLRIHRADGRLPLIGGAGADADGGRFRTGIAAVLTVLALLLVWAALVAPYQPGRLTPGALVGIPIEGLVLIALVLLLPRTAGRVLAGAAGLTLGVLVIVKLLDIGFLTAFDRPFNPVDDWSFTGIGIETLRDSVGRREANLLLVGAVVLAIGLIVFTTLAVLRLSRVAAGRRRRSLQVIGALGVVWLLAWAFNAHLVGHTPVASASSADLVAGEAHVIRVSLQGQAAFAREIAHDRFANTPGSRLLTALRGKDVLLVFVESYGRVAVQGSSFSPQVDAALKQETRQLQAAGFGAKSAFLTSSTFGGISWLAHSTVQSGVWVDSPRRYDELLSSNRLTLTEAFNRAGWRTVDDVPSNDRDWKQGTSFYHWDKLYDRRNVGYHGPTYAYASMPDQYVFLALQRLELGKTDRRPLFAEVDMVSSHEPWTRIPQMIDWGAVGDGSIFNRMPVDQTTRADLWSDSSRVRAAYGRSIEYSLNALVSFIQHYGNDNLVLVVMGDHQPATIVTGQGASHDVPVSVIAHDPAVLGKISSWGWQSGLLPSPTAPVWPMNAFRDRFLTAFGSQPAGG